MTWLENEQLIDLLTKFQKDVHQTAVDKGWYDPTQGEVKQFLGELMLMVSELAEAAEAYRADLPVYFKDEKGKPEGIASELADTVIRILDTAEARGIPVVQAMVEKSEFNKTRPMRHGGKKS